MAQQSLWNCASLYTSCTKIFQSLASERIMKLGNVKKKFYKGTSLGKERTRNSNLRNTTQLPPTPILQDISCRLHLSPLD